MGEPIPPIPPEPPIPPPPPPPPPPTPCPDCFAELPATLHAKIICDLPPARTYTGIISYTGLGTYHGFLLWGEGAECIILINFCVGPDNALAMRTYGMPWFNYAGCYSPNGFCIPSGSCTDYTGHYHFSVW